MGFVRQVLAFSAVAALAVPSAARVGVAEQDSTPSGLKLSHAANEAAGAGAGSSASGASSSGTGGTSGFDTEEGGFYFASDEGDYRLVIGGRIQARFEGIANEDSSTVTLDDVANFEVRRARLYVLGNVFNKQTKYLLQMGSDRGRDFEVLDAWLKFARDERFAVKGGQFKLPFNRQQLTSSGKLQLTERAVASDEFRLNGDSRDKGFELSGGVNENRFQWAAAISNGQGRNQPNGDTQFQYTARATVNPSGDYGYSESDIGFTEGYATTLGLSVGFQRDESVPDISADVFSLNIDGGVKHRGASLQGEFYYRTTDANVPDVARGTAGRDMTSLLTSTSPLSITLDDFGMYVQGGYFIQPENAEIAGRYSRVFFDGSSNDITEATVGFSYFWFGHRLKWQTDYSFFDFESTGLNSHRMVTQAQLGF